MSSPTPSAGGRRAGILSAERIDAALARQLGLVHEISPVEQLDARIGKLVSCAGRARRPGRSQALLADLRAGSPLDDALLEKPPGTSPACAASPRRAKG